MTKARRRPNYDRKLSRRIVLVDGRALVTLGDAGKLIQDEFASVNLKWGPLDHCIVLLIEAAEHGGKERIAAATDQLDIVLRGRRLI